MRRAFLSLYLVIVCAVLGFSWATERVWQVYVSGKDELDVSLDQQRFMRLLMQVAKAEAGDNHDSQDLERHLSRYTESLSLQLKVFHFDEFANSELKTKLQEGLIVPVSKQLGSVSYYALLEDQLFVIELIQPQNTESKDFIDVLLVIAFYLLIAIAIYFWIWPLSRDLKILKSQTRTLMNLGEAGDIELSKQSAVYDLATAFNTMRNKITSLLSSQKEMTHAMSHELRTPLARMKFTLASLESTLGEEDLRLEQLRENISEMDKLISDFLNYASFEEGRRNIQFERGRLAPMIRRVAENLEIFEQVTITDKLENQEAWCEWYLMEHCVRMILENAKRYALSKINIELGFIDGSYEISVEDDGPGVPEGERESIFNAFFKSNDTCPNSTGFGLGLALVYRMMTWHNGIVSCDSSSLGGARFRLRWQRPKPEGKEKGG